MPSSFRENKIAKSKNVVFPDFSHILKILLKTSRLKPYLFAFRHLHMRILSCNLQNSFRFILNDSGIKFMAPGQPGNWKKTVASFRKKTNGPILTRGSENNVLPYSCMISEKSEPLSIVCRKSPVKFLAQSFRCNHEIAWVEISGSKMENFSFISPNF